MPDDLYHKYESKQKLPDSAQHVVDTYYPGFPTKCGYKKDYVKLMQAYLGVNEDGVPIRNAYYDPSPDPPKQSGLLGSILDNPVAVGTLLYLFPVSSEVFAGAATGAGITMAFDVLSTGFSTTQCDSSHMKSYPEKFQTYGPNQYPMTYGIHFFGLNFSDAPLKDWSKASGVFYKNTDYRDIAGSYVLVNPDTMNPETANHFRWRVGYDAFYDSLVNGQTVSDMLNSKQDRLKPSGHQDKWNSAIAGTVLGPIATVILVPFFAIIYNDETDNGWSHSLSMFLLFWIIVCLVIIGLSSWAIGWRLNEIKNNYEPEKNAVIDANNAVIDAKVAKYIADSIAEYRRVNPEPKLFYDAPLIPKSA